MALKALTTVDTVKYVSDADPAKTYEEVAVDGADPAKGTKRVEKIDEASATTFTLRPLDAFLNAHIYDNASTLTGKQGSDDVRINTRVNQTNVDAVRAADDAVARGRRQPGGGEPDFGEREDWNGFDN